MLGSVAPAQAQLLQITAGGEITNASGIYSAVPTGTPFTFTENFNIANATLISSTGSAATYTDPTGTASFSFDGFDLSGTAPQILINSNVQADGTSIYGFEFSQSLTSGGGFAVQLLSIDSSVAPSISLNSVDTSPMSDFFPSLNLAELNQGGNNYATGTNTSFSVQVESVPEPSSVALFALAVPLLWWLRSRRQREGIAA